MMGNTLKALFSGIGEIISEVEKIALHLGENKIRVWVVLPDDANALDKKLMLQVAKINAELENGGYFVDLYTVEKSDNISIPNQFKEITIQ